MELKASPSRATSSASTSPGPDLVGKKFGDFHVLKLLGEGGMGQVYLAEQLSLKRKVAIKVLRKEVAAKATSLQRFKAESKTVAQLTHANIVQVYMIGEHESCHYMVLEYVEGKSLRDYLAKKGPLEAPLVLSIMRQVANALQRASELGIVHRDIKPENILLTRKGEAKVADFGLARCLTEEAPVNLTRAGTALGTPLYMSPEQVEGKSADHRSDIYSFGVTCYHMLTGQAPFTGSNGFEVALKHVRAEPPPLEKFRPDIPPALGALVRKMMAKKPSARYQSAQELLRDIARVRELVYSTTGTTAVEPPSGKVRRQDSQETTSFEGKRSGLRPWLLALVVVGVLALVVGRVVSGLVLLQSSDDAEGETTVAQQTVSPAPQQAAEVNKQKEQKEKELHEEKEKELREQKALKEREESLRKSVERHLKGLVPNPNGVDDCIDLAVVYLDQNRVTDAEALFKRMDSRKAPSTYHYIGHLGLAVTDALQKNYRASQSKFVSLFDTRSRDNRAKIINDYLEKNPEFAQWVNEADTHNVRNGVSEPSITQKLSRYPTKGPSPFRFLFKK